MNVAGTLFTADDEAPHLADDDQHFSESVYFNFVDNETKLAGFMRVGNRVNAGHGEVTALVYLPDGRVAFSYSRPEIASATFDLDGYTVDVVEPLHQIRLSYAADVHVLADGMALSNPREAFAVSPVEPCSFTLDFKDVMPLIGWKRDAPDSSIDPGGTFAPNHYEAVCRVQGTLVVGGSAFAIDGRGLRDHSWGRRDWNAPDFYRWIECLDAEGNGFIGWLTQIGGRRSTWGFRRDGDRVIAIDGLEVSTTYDGPEKTPTETRISVSAGGERISVTGRCAAIAPLRHRTPTAVARLSEMVLEYHDGDGLVGRGIAEFHDTMVDGVPAGMGHA